MAPIFFRTLVVLFALSSGSTASAGPAHVGHVREHVLPERADTAAYRSQHYRRSGVWLISDVSQPDSPGYRVAAMIESASDVALEARGVNESGTTGAWQPLEVTFRGQNSRVAVADLDGSWPRAQIRVFARHDGLIESLSWELLEPRYPEVGRAVREIASSDPHVLSASASEVAAELAALGVISRQQWGARPTGCSSAEDDWYRMAIHHTAGPQARGDSIQEVVRGLQAYAQDSGSYCDIPYQYLVGFDGSLWEARPPTMTSGATGGGNNNGNLAICFMGCYHPSGCPAGVPSVPATEEMMIGARLLAHTLSRLHDISMAADNVRGHRDWPGNSTACPGQFVHDRLDEVRTPVSWVAAESVGRSFSDEGVVAIATGETVDLWIDMKNTGGLAWEPGITFLAPSDPRDTPSPMATPAWPSPTRAATVDSPVGPGEVGRFSFQIQAPSNGEALVQTFSLVQEGVTWFADTPRGGGPAEGDIVVELDIDDDSPDGRGQIDQDSNLAGGCSATGTSRSSMLLLLVVIAILRQRPRLRRTAARRSR